MTFCSQDRLGQMGRDFNSVFPAQANKNLHVLVRQRLQSYSNSKKVMKECLINTVYKVDRY